MSGFNMKTKFYISGAHDAIRHEAAAENTKAILMEPFHEDAVCTAKFKTEAGNNYMHIIFAGQENDKPIFNVLHEVRGGDDQPHKEFWL